MKNLLMASNGERIAARILKSATYLLTAFALGAMFWVASTSTSHAQSMTPEKMIQAELPQGVSVATAGKADFLAALCAAVTKHRSAAPQLASFSVNLHPDWKKDILRTVFRCLGTDDCRLLARVVRVLAIGRDAAEITALAVELAPNCAGSFGVEGKDGVGRVDEGAGDFGAPPGNLNPPPGSIGGGGGGVGNVIAICFNGVTRFFSPEGAQAFLAAHPGATLGACVVTPVQNR